MQQIGRYRIKSEIARGGMAIVFHAFDPSFERDVAIKLLPRQFLYNDPAARARFQREVKTIAALEHSAIVPVYDVGIHDEQPFLVMRLMTGGSLADKIREKPLPIEDALILCDRIGSALDEAHSQGIVHRDLKSNNILYDHRGDAFLSDFGIAKLTETGASLTETSILVGTPAYMSPEQALGEAGIDHRSDIYSLGVILYEALSGNLPFRAETPMGVAMKHVMEPAPPLPEFDEPFQSFMQRALAKDPNERFGDMNQMRQGLKAVAAGEPLPPLIKLPANDEEYDDDELPAVDSQSAFSIPRWLTYGVSGLLVALLTVFIWERTRLGPVDAANQTQTPTATNDAIAALSITVTGDNVSQALPSPTMATPTATLSATLTATPTLTPSPTATEISPTPTISPSPTATLVPGTLCPNFPEVKVRSEPSVISLVLALLVEGQCTDIVARTSDNAWYLVQINEEEQGWVAADVVDVTRTLGVVSIPLAATVPPTPMVTETPTRFVATFTPIPPTPTNTPTPTLTPTQTPPALITWIMGIAPEFTAPIGEDVNFSVTVAHSLQTNLTVPQTYYTSVWVEGFTEEACEGLPAGNFSTVIQTDVSSSGETSFDVQPDLDTIDLSSVSVIIRVGHNSSPSPQPGDPNYLEGCYAIAR